MSTFRRLKVEMQTNRELRREAYSMSLYVAIVLMSALSIFSEDHPPDQGEVMLLELGTTVGLVLAHGFASWLSTQIMGSDSSEREGWDLLLVQLGGALAIGLLATLAAVIAPSSVELEAARLTVAGAIAALVYLESRATNSAARAGAYALLALVAGVAVASVKAALVH